MALVKALFGTDTDGGGDGVAEGIEELPSRGTMIGDSCADVDFDDDFDDDDEACGNDYKEKLLEKQRHSRNAIVFYALLMLHLRRMSVNACSQHSL